MSAATSTHCAFQLYLTDMVAQFMAPTLKCAGPCRCGVHGTLTTNAGMWTGSSEYGPTMHLACVWM
jgi:hypothetical protein